MIHHEIEIKQAERKDHHAFMGWRPPVGIGKDLISIKDHRELGNVLECPVLAPQIEAKTGTGDQKQDDPGQWRVPCHGALGGC